MLLLSLLATMLGYIYSLKAFRAPKQTVQKLALNAFHDQISVSHASAPPLKTMIFIDGTWLYYSLIHRGQNHRVSPVELKFGENWQRRYRIDWLRLPALVTQNLNKQLTHQNSYRRHTEVRRTSVFTSLRPDTAVGGPREQMVSGFYSAYFDVHKFQTDQEQEKCVDIALAVEMLYMATVPDAYEVAVIITGDKDFLPALEKTRLMAKKVAICSMRNSCNRFLATKDSSIRDFDVIWIDDLLDDLIVPKDLEYDQMEATLVDTELIELISNWIKSSNNLRFSSRIVGRQLQQVTLKINQKTDALTILKKHHNSLRMFLEKYNDIFVIHDKDNIEFEMSLVAQKDETDDELEELDLEENEFITDYSVKPIVRRTNKLSLNNFEKEHSPEHSPEDSSEDSSEDYYERTGIPYPKFFPKISTKVMAKEVTKALGAWTEKKLEGAEFNSVLIFAIFKILKLLHDSEENEILSRYLSSTLTDIPAISAAGVNSNLNYILKFTRGITVAVFTLDYPELFEQDYRLVTDEYNRKRKKNFIRLATLDPYKLNEIEAKLRAALNLDSTATPVSREKSSKTTTEGSENLESLTVKQLKDKLRRKNLSVGGTKRQLIQRIVGDFHDDDDGSHDWDDED